jgi:hypothetical protein
MGDARCGGQWFDLADSFREVGGLLETALSLPGDYGLQVLRKAAGPDGEKEVVRYVWC